MFNQIGCDILTFANAAEVANLIVQSSVKYNSISIVYNKLFMAISYKLSQVFIGQLYLLCTHWGSCP